MKILVCEDDVVLHKVIQVALESQNHEVTFVKDGLRALDLLRKDAHFDLIITDIHMPYQNGDAILQFVREEQKKTTPIIMISSDNEEEVISLALKSGVNDFISKPLSTEKVLRSLKKVLQ
jgi:CheY-like chemotaxis protein